MLDLSELDGRPGRSGRGAPRPTTPSPRCERDVTAEVDGRRFSVKLWVPDLVRGGRCRRAPSGPSGRPQAAAGATGSGDVTVPMQGTIVKVLVAVGDTVEVGQTICLLEAMKMENAVNAEKDGVIKEVRVSAGASVGAGDIVAVIE